MPRLFPCLWLRQPELEVKFGGQQLGGDISCPRTVLVRLGESVDFEAGAVTWFTPASGHHVGEEQLAEETRQSIWRSGGGSPGSQVSLGRCNYIEQRSEQMWAWGLAT